MARGRPQKEAPIIFLFVRLVRAHLNRLVDYRPQLKELTVIHSLQAHSGLVGRPSLVGCQLWHTNPTASTAHAMMYQIHSRRILALMVIVKFLADGARKPSASLHPQVAPPWLSKTFDDGAITPGMSTFHHPPKWGTGRDWLPPRGPYGTPHPVNKERLPSAQGPKAGLSGRLLRRWGRWRIRGNRVL